MIQTSEGKTQISTVLSFFFRFFLSKPTPYLEHHQNFEGHFGRGTIIKIPKIPFPPSLPTKLPSIKIIISSSKHPHSACILQALSPIVTFYPSHYVCPNVGSKLADHFNKICRHLSSNLNPSIAKRKTYITHFGHQGNPSLPNIPHLTWTKEEKEKKEEGRENAIAHISACTARRRVARCVAASSTTAPIHKYPAQTQTPIIFRAAQPQPQTRSRQYGPSFIHRQSASLSWSHHPSQTNSGSKPSPTQTSSQTCTERQKAKQKNQKRTSSQTCNSPSPPQPTILLQVVSSTSHLQ